MAKEDLIAMIKLFEQKQNTQPVTQLINGGGKLAIGILIARIHYTDSTVDTKRGKINQNRQASRQFIQKAQSRAMVENKLDYTETSGTREIDALFNCNSEQTTFKEAENYYAKFQKQCEKHPELNKVLRLKEGR